MYHYYTYDGRTLCSAGALPYPEISALPETGEVLCCLLYTSDAADE